ncbi:hypothetical protein B0T26DRAFT_825962 [Lasiosphaeria miniovina]|uniref:Uncharacterized protein n=1 Tax=Lasiosphaeria miniovina TaxID=1954250 RepID=A0AA40AUV8_9PEZI|nr:uncharacterized protein B0T26DRAFT_825962 [Lasiosphaeria miniovina]KAK0722396.1 hypothetical protein B0T26DRAFT_825962 [Lasiosphaeria miniovina]
MSEKGVQVPARVSHRPPASPAAAAGFVGVLLATAAAGICRHGGDAQFSPNGLHTEPRNPWISAHPYLDAQVDS